MSEQTRIATRCPACNSSTLFIANGNWLTCSLIGCPDPTLINSTGERLKAYWDDKQKAEKQNEALREQNRVLLKALRVAVFLDGPDTVQPEFERWSLLVDEGLKKNFNEWYAAQVIAALTATSQEGQHESR